MRENCEETISAFYRNKIREEEKYVEYGPLKRAVQKDVHYQNSSEYGVENDFAGDDMCAIDSSNAILHKYSDRLLVLMTRKCVSECAYCFRQVNRQTNIAELEVIEITNRVIAYLKQHDTVKEVILSGGDPILLGDEKLAYFFKRVSSETNIKNFRLHTRSIVYMPDLLADSVIKVLSDYHVRLIFHIIHPYELCDTVKQKIKFICDSGIRCYNQFPLLRGINDHVAVISELLYILDQNRVRNLSIFITDPLNCIEEYRVSIKRCYEMWQCLETQYPSWINATKMVFDSSIGKVNIKNLIEYDRDRGGYWFQRQDKKIFFKDIPGEVDTPGDLTAMLWKKDV